MGEILSEFLSLRQAWDVYREAAEAQVEALRRERDASQRAFTRAVDDLNEWHRRFVAAEAQVEALRRERDEALAGRTTARHFADKAESEWERNQERAERAEAEVTRLREALNEVERQRAVIDQLTEIADGLRRERDAAQTASFVQVGWLGPYGLIPGGMDNDPDPKWRPVYVQSLSAPKEGDDGE